MKVSINLAQEFSNVDIKGIKPESILNSIGSQLGAVEEVIYWAHKYEGVVVVKVVECEKHPNADKLNVCKIDDGGVVKDIERDKSGYVQVVCGAPNVKKDMFVAWIPPRATVPSTKGTDDEFVLESRELRGVVSNGMLASAHELGINDDHSGILEITETSAGKKPIPGDAFVSYFGLDDVVIDCENKMFTHRPDCFGNLGVARELAGINGLNFKSPDWYVNAVSVEKESKLLLESNNEIPDLVPRFMAQVIEGVDVVPSGLKMQVDLARVGLRALNNIVDLTNYFMHLTAQPTHAFDYDKIKKLSGDVPKLFPRRAKDGEELTLLNGKTIKLTSEDVVISTDKKAVALAGVMGGAETEVDDNTKNIIIECATFDMYAVRRTSMRHGLFTDAVTRFNKGQSPLQNDKILAKLVNEITKITNSKAGMLIDIKSDKVKPLSPVRLNVDFIITRLGREFSPEEIADLLKRTEFEVDINGNDITIKPPYWRMDIECPEDIVEEVGRLYGFSNLPTELPVRKAVTVSRNASLTLKRNLAKSLKSFGANEILTYSFVHQDLLKASNQNTDDAYQIRNAISPELQFYRMSLTPSVAQHVHANIKAGYSEFGIFEIGKIHNKNYGLNEENVPIEKDTIAFVYAANDKVSKSKDTNPYYVAQDFARHLMDSFNINIMLEAAQPDFELVKPYDVDRSAVIKCADSGQVLGIVGEFHQVLRNKLKLPKYSAGFELYIDAINSSQKNIKYKILSKYPSTEQDITIEVSKDITFRKIKENIDNFLNDYVKGRGYDIKNNPVSVYSDSDSKKRLTFRINVSHPEKTLTTEEINKMIDQLSDNLKNTLGAERI